MINTAHRFIVKYGTVSFEIEASNTPIFLKLDYLGHNFLDAFILIIFIPVCIHPNTWIWLMFLSLFLKTISCLLEAPTRGPGLQLRRVPCPVIQLATFQFAGPTSNPLSDTSHGKSTFL